MSFDFFEGPGRSGRPWPFAWRYGTGTFDPTSGLVSARSDSSFFGSNFDGAGVGTVFNIVREQQLMIYATLTARADSEAYGFWGYANAEPMFDLWLRGMDPSTNALNHHAEWGMMMRAVAPVFGFVQIRNQVRTVGVGISVSLPILGVRPGRVFAGAGVKTYAGTGGFLCTSTASARSTISQIRIVGFD